jgi:hypothetical protein
VSGNLDVKGTTTYIESTTLQVEDKNIEIGKVSTPTDSTANGGGISLLGDTTKTFSWYSATGAWTSSENLALEAGKNLILNGSISGTTTLQSNQSAGSTILTLPVSAGDTLIGRATTDTLTNKTFDTAGTGNYLYINGTQITAVSGTGSVILSSSPTIGSPTITGHATIEGRTLTGVTGTGNLVLALSPTLTSPSFSTIVNTGTLTLPTSTDTLVGRNTTDTLTNKTLTSPNISTIVNSGTLTLPTSTDTLVGRDTTDILTNKTFDITTNTFEYSGTQINNVTGTGNLVLDTAPSIANPTITGHPTIEGVTSTGATGSGKFVFDHSPSLTTPSFSSIVNSGTLTLPTSTDTLVGRATTDTLTNKTYDTAGTGNLFYINGTAITDVTGSGKVVLDTAPTIDNLSIAGYITSDTYTGGQISWSTDNQTDFQGNIKIGGNVIKSGGGASSITLNNNGFTSPQIIASTSLTVQGTTDSVSTSTGSLITLGGAGISKNLNVGGNLNIAGTTTLSDNTQINSDLTVTGNTLLGDLQISGDTISSSSSNANITLSPNGTGAIDVATHKIINLTNPTANQDAATKYYVDNSIASVASSGTITFVGDSGSSLPIALGQTIKIKGGYDIATSTSASIDGGTLTVQSTMSQIDGGDAASYVTFGQNPGGQIYSDSSLGTTGTGSVVLQDGPVLVSPNLVTPSFSSILNTGTLTLPTSTTTLIGNNTVNTLTNKTFDTAGTGNILYINGTSITAVTGSGSVVLATSPTLTTPNISTIVNSGTLTLPTSTDTLVGRDTTDTLTNKSFNSSINYQTSGTNIVNDTVSQATVATVSPSTVDSWLIGTYRSAKYLIQITQGTNYQVSELMIAHDGTNTYLNEFGVIETNGTLGTFTASVDSGSNVLLTVTMISGISATINIKRSLVFI